MKIENLCLTDFTSDELNFLFLVLEEKRKDHECKLEFVGLMDPSELKYELYDHNNKMVNYCSQWQTKVDEAAKFVKTREIMQSNN